MEYDKLIEFFGFISKRYFTPPHYIVDNHIVMSMNKVLKDVHYWNPTISNEDIVSRICSGKNELVNFLYRLGRNIYLESPDSEVLDMRL